jgi:insulysin
VIGDNDAKLLEQVTKEDVLSLFTVKLDPSSSKRAKLSIHMRSQKPRPKHLSFAALNAFDGVLEDAGIDTQDWRGEIGAGDAEEPPLNAAEQYWRKKLPVNKVEELLKKLAQLVDEHPAECDYEGTLRPEVKLIEDVAAFKASLLPTPEPRPLVEWGDLPPSKL